ncbi:MAG: glycoside hydrolase family 27 protein [Bacteroidaceae bacterium]|nr:glycoside hydrolase family 27 protein [Bacteroidaceae bacterium]
MKYLLTTALFLITLLANATEYILFSAGMPENAVITILGTEYRGVNAQGDTRFEAETLSDADIIVTVGGGYAYHVSIDNNNHQVSIDFKQCFTPSKSAKADTLYQYVMKMPMAYVKVAQSNIGHTAKKSEADKFVFIEDTKNTGCYYIYDVSAKRYITYTSTSEGSSVKATSSSNVRMSGLMSQAKTWKFVLRDDKESVSVMPGTVKSPTDATPSWNFTGGVDNGCVLNLYRASDRNSAWTVMDSSRGSLACATSLFSLPGQEFMHRLVPEEGQTVADVDFGVITTLRLCDDRAAVGNKYKYVKGTAPEEEGDYTYTVRIQNGEGSVETVPVKLTVSSHLQSPTPMMGWLTWNWFARAISHDKILNIVKGMENKGLIDAGYNTIVLDDAWGTNQSDKAKLTYDSAKFPKGISGFVKACKDVNPEIRIGIYSDAGSMTCENYQPGSYGYERQHIQLFDSWGVDMLKYDFCNSQSSAYPSYAAMGAVIADLNSQRRTAGNSPFVFNICEWGSNQPWTWGPEAGGSSWRATNDARECWIGNHSRPGVLGGVDEVRDLWMWAGVNRFNDLDMMTIGLHGLGGPSNNIPEHMSNGGVITGLTDEQARTQMALWCMLSSPLSLTCDFRTSPKAEANGSAGTLPRPLITESDIATLSNRYLIGINQDPMGQQAEYMEGLSTGSTDFSRTGYDVYVKDLSGGRMAVAVTNRSSATQTTVSIALTDIYLCPSTGYLVTDAWTGSTSGITDTLSTGSIRPYQTKVYIISPDPTSVTSAPTGHTTPATKTYDVSGRPVTTQANGIYIHDGAKVLSQPCH